MNFSFICLYKTIIQCLFKEVHKCIISSKKLSYQNNVVLKYQYIIEFVYVHQINTRTGKPGIKNQELSKNCNLFSKQRSHLYAADNVWYAILKCNNICIA